MGIEARIGANSNMINTNIDKKAISCIIQYVDASKQIFQITKGYRATHMSLLSLNSELAYEFVPTANEQILAIDEMLNEL